MSDRWPIYVCHACGWCMASEQDDLTCENCGEPRSMIEAVEVCRVSERDHWKANHDDQVRRKQVAQGEVERLRGAIEDYLLWEPRRAGHAAAHHKLAESLVTFSLFPLGGRR